MVNEGERDEHTAPMFFVGLEGKAVNPVLISTFSTLEASRDQRKRKKREREGETAAMSTIVLTVLIVPLMVVLLLLASTEISDSGRGPRIGVADVRGR